MKALPAILSWSGGKDSALALHVLRQDARYEVQALLTSVNQHYGRISMHGVRETLLDAQAEAIGLPLHKIRLSERSSNEEYEQKLRAALENFKARGIRHVAFGDLFLEDIRRYRERNLARLHMECLFPLWQRPTPELAREFLALGFRAVLCCVDGEALDGGFSGREYDERLLRQLPPGTDPCGENGEFHTFVYAGPVFRHAIHFMRGERVKRDERFHFCDLIPAQEAPA